MPEPRLVCIGNVTIDEAVQPDGTSTDALGGDALFAVLAARVAGNHHAQWLAPIGTDMPPDARRRLESMGLSTQPTRELPTVRNIVRYAADGTRRWELVHGEDHFDAMSIHPSDIPPGVLDADGVLVLAMSLAAQLEVVPWLRRHSAAALYLDLQEDYVAGHEAELLDLAASSDVFLPSEIEAGQLTGTDDPRAAARILSGAGPRVVVVKLAERGCLVAEGGVVTEVATDAVVPVDPTGAGDAFCGAFAAVHLATGDALRAARAGAAAARVAVSGPGVSALMDAVTSGVPA